MKWKRIFKEEGGLRSIEVLTNQKGFNLMQMVVAMGIMGIVGMGALKISEQSSKSTKAYEQGLEMDAFLADIARQLGKKDNCELNFQNVVLDSSPAAFDPVKIKNNDGSAKDFLSQGDEYRAKSLRLEQIQALILSPDTMRINLTFEQLKKKSGYNKLIKSVDLNVVTTHEGGGDYRIKSCIFSNADAAAGANDSIAAEICEGLGLVKKDKKCYIKDFFQSYEQTLECGLGQTLARITYEDDDYFNRGHCRNVFTKPATCPGEKIRDVAADGSIVCLDAGQIANNSFVALYNGVECSLKVATADGRQKLGLNCDCDPLCPEPDQVCQGETNTDPDGCGGNCNVVGTKTGGYCDSCDASNESSTRVKLRVTSSGQTASCPANQAEYDDWLDDNWVQQFHVPDNTPEIDFTGGKMMVDLMATTDCFRAYTYSTGDTKYTAGQYLIAAGSVQTNLDGDKVPHLVTVNGDGTFHAQKCATFSSTPPPSTCSYPNFVNGYNECTDACPDGPTYFYSCNEGDVTPAMLCEAGDTCHCVEDSNPAPGSMPCAI